MNYGSLFDELTLALGVLLLFFAARAFRSTRRFIANCRTAAGRIADYTKEDSEDGVYYFSIIRFRDGSGREQEIRGSHGLQEPPVVGTPVSITYDTTAPTNAWVTGTSGPWVIPWLILIVGIALVVASFVIRAEG